MPFAINLTLDPESSEVIERAYARARALKVKDDDIVGHYGPCITVLVIEDQVSAEAIAQCLEMRLPTLRAFCVTFTEPCIILGIPPTLSLRVRPDQALLDLHHALFSEFPEDAVHLHYRPAYWQPHAKLANLRESHAATLAFLEAFTSGYQAHTGKVQSIEVIYHWPVEAIWRARLQRRPEN